jgi:hypothetical protein
VLVNWDQPPHPEKLIEAIVMAKIRDGIRNLAAGVTLGFQEAGSVHRLLVGTDIQTPPGQRPAA